MDDKTLLRQLVLAVLLKLLILFGLWFVFFRGVQPPQLLSLFVSFTCYDRYCLVFCGSC